MCYKGARCVAAAPAPGSAAAGGSAAAAGGGVAGEIDGRRVKAPDCPPCQVHPDRSSITHTQQQRHAAARAPRAARKARQRAASPAARARSKARRARRTARRARSAARRVASAVKRAVKCSAFAVFCVRFRRPIHSRRICCATRACSADGRQARGSSAAVVRRRLPPPGGEANATPSEQRNVTRPNAAVTQRAR